MLLTNGNFISAIICPQAALALVEEETRRYRPTKNYLEHLPQVDVAAFETEIMKTEFERLSHRQPMEMLNMKRYELPQPPAGKLNDLTAWKDSVRRGLPVLRSVMILGCGRSRYLVVVGVLKTDLSSF